MSEVQRKRGRPATIDTDAAMQALVELFRSKGYSAVSLDDLSDATGLSRPSLYRSFGNKLSMYLGAMDAFGHQVSEMAVPALRAEGPLQSALSNFYDAMLSIYYRDSDVAPGCLVFGTAPSSAEEAEIQQRLEFGITSTDRIMRDRIVQAASSRDEADIQMAVDIAANTLIAFSARAKSGATRATLSAMGRRSAKAICSLLDVD